MNNEFRKLSKPMMTISQVAKLLSVAERTVYQWANDGEIPAYKVGNSWRFMEEELEQWVTSRSNVGKAAGSGPAKQDDDAPEQDWSERVSAFAQEIVKFLRNSDERIWILDTLADKLNTDILLVRAAAKQLVVYERCETGTMFIGGKQRETIQLKKGS